MFMYVDFNSAHEVVIVLAVKHYLFQRKTKEVDQLYDSEPTADEQNGDGSTSADVSVAVLTDEPSDQSSELSVDISQQAIESDESDAVYIPYIDEKSDQYFSLNDRSLRQQCRSSRWAVWTALLYVLIGLNKFASLLVPCTPHPSHVSASPAALSSLLTERSYTTLSMHLLHSLELGWTGHLLSYCIPPLAIAGPVLALSQTLQLGLSSPTAVLHSAVLLALLASPFVLLRLLRTSVDVRLDTILQYWNDEHSEQQLRLVRRSRSYRHHQLWFKVPLQRIALHSQSDA